MRNRESQVRALDKAYKALKKGRRLKLRWKWIAEKPPTTMECLSNDYRAYGYISVSDDGWYEIFMWDKQDRRMLIKVSGQYSTNVGRDAESVLLEIDKAVCGNNPALS